MNGVHDMGGMQGFGAVDPKDDDVFHTDWEGRMFALNIATSVHMGGSLDSWRHELEKLPPQQYLEGYFQRWFHVLLNQGEAVGLFDEATREKIEKGQNISVSEADGTSLDAEFLTTILKSGAPSLRTEGPSPLFEEGQKVRAVNDHPDTHTRLPRYVRGKVGEIITCHGNHVFPDARAQGKGEDPQPLYSVRFSARELWGEKANAADSVSLDLWQPYLRAL